MAGIESSCKIERCERKVVARGMCDKHWRRWRKEATTSDMAKPSIVESFEAKFMPEPNSGCWIWTASLRTTGYGQFRLRGRSRPAHRVAFELYKGVDPGSMHVCHRCDVRECVNPDHLWLGTNLDNRRDSIAKGRHVPPPRIAHVGSKNPQSKLTEVQAAEIKRLLSAGALGTEIADMFGVHANTIYDIRHGRAWANV